MRVENPNPAQREYARVETHLAIRYRRAHAEELLAFEERVVGADAGEDDLPLALVAYLRNIEFKLDLVLARLDPSFESPLDPKELRAVVLSAGGVQLPAEGDAVDVGDAVRIEMLLPGDAQRTVVAMGRVSRIVGASLAIEYGSIAETDRDAIVRFVNRLQLAQERRARNAR
jgi:hypothetical protein